MTGASGGSNGGKAKSAILAAALALPVPLFGWTLLEVSSLKERAAKGEAERDANRRIMLAIQEDLRVMSADIKALLARR